VRTNWPVAGRESVRLIGWLPAAGGAVLVALLLVLNGTIWRGEDCPLVSTVRIVDTIVPLAVGVQAAFLLSPEDERPLELLLSLPRPIAWALWERVGVMLTLQGGVALAGNVIASTLLGGEGIAQTVARWLVPCVWFGGVAVAVALLTRQGVLGALLATLLWGGTLLGGDGLLDRYPFLWPLHAYLQPEHVSDGMYALNRAALMLAGVLLVSLAACLTRDEEHMLGVPGVKELVR
jgi:hypothetical protein